MSLSALLRSLRPLQWTKNGVVFAAVVFGGKFVELGTLSWSLVAALVFCGVSSAGYLVNDVRDVEHDRLHPEKRRRPIAAGAVTPALAIALAVALVVGGLVVAWTIRPGFAAVVATYAALTTAYSFGLKRLVILDAFAVAAGFVLRAAGGAVAIGVPVSPWLYACTMLLALLVAFGKRRHELANLGHSAARHRANLDAYSLPLLDQLVGTAAAATVVAYSLYTFEAATLPRSHAMMLTIPFVTYAVFRYLYLVHRHGLGGSPETLVFADRPLLMAIVGWAVTVLVINYAPT